MSTEGPEWKSTKLPEGLEENIASLAAEMERLVGEARSQLAQIASARAQATEEQATIAAKSAHIEDAKSHAEEVKNTIERLQGSASTAANDVDALKDRAQTASDGAVQLEANMRARKETIDAELGRVEEARVSAFQARDTLSGLAAKASETQNRIAAYEANLHTLGQQCELQLKTIQDLLPGATSAGLASAFDARRQTFTKPSKNWQWLFVGSIVCLVMLAATALWKSSDAKTYDDLLRLWLSRIPIGGALVWLAIHAARESALAKRLEEDYGYKAAVAASFLGFNRQMAEIASTTTEGSPLSKLCSDTLATIANPPGRIYEKHELMTTPADKMMNIFTAPAKPSE